MRRVGRGRIVGAMTGRLPTIRERISDEPREAAAIALYALTMLYPAPPIVRLVRALLVRREIERAFRHLEDTRRRAQRTNALLAVAALGALALVGRLEARRPGAAA
jgi:hypothetical protein